MAFADLTANLRLNIADFSAKMTTASKQMTDFAKGLNAGYGVANATLRSHNLGLKDTARIVQGIIVSQAFYAVASSIREATSALWEFNKSLDYANVTYSALFGDTKLAGDFMKVLQEHAINTMFDYQDLTDASKKLLAYGIEYENLMFIMEGLTNLGAMSGDSAALDRISLALGQIYTKGKLSAEEMRQLSNAYVPISDIIQEKFNLSAEDMERVGDLNLPAEEVINAIVDYANERFGSVGDAAMYTITGIQAKIVDTLKVVGTEMLASTTVAYKSFLVYLSEGLDSIRTAYADGGAGGVFEFLVPNEETQNVIRQFIANVKNLFMSLVSVGVVAGHVFGNFAYVLVTAFNMAAPLITGFVNILAGVLNAMLSTSTGAKILRIALLTAAGAFVILKVQALAALVVTAVTKAVMGLAKALLLLATLVVKHPILMLLAGLAIALVGVSVASSNANKSIMGLFDTLSGAGGGASQADILQKIEKDIQNSADAADQFNNRLGDGKDAAKELEDGINGAGKAAKKAAGLLSFDEVFKLNEQKNASGSGAGSGIAGDIGNLIDGLGTLGDALIPEIPDFSEFIDGFTDGLFGGIETGIFERLKTSAIGALIGGGIGAIIGGIIGGPAGAVLGAKIGAFVGGLIGLFKDEIVAFLKTDAGIGASIGTGLGGIIGALIGGPMGAAIGTGVGALVGGLVGLFKDELKAFFTSDTGLGAVAGAGIGAIFGTLLGGPAGGLIGAGIGALLGGLFGMFKDELTVFFDDVVASIETWWNDTAQAFEDWKTDTVESISTWWTDTKEGFSTWCSDVYEDVSDWCTDVKESFSDWKEETGKKISDWWTDTKTGFSNWTSEVATNVATWVADTKTSFNTWKTETGNKISTWWSETKTGFSNWKTDTASKISTWYTETKNNISSWAVEGKQKLSTWWAETKTGFATWKTEVGKSISTWASEAFVSIRTNFYNIDSKLGEFFGLETSFSDFCTNTLKSIKTWASDVWDSIKDKFGKAIEKVKEFLKVDDSVSSSSASRSVGGSSRAGILSLSGHAAGGIFTKEHIARFAEGNRAEAVIPLENAGAMQPFVDAISNGIVSSLAPILATSGGSANQLPPMYIGTLVADDRGLKQLYKKFELIQVQENARKGKK